MTKDKSAAIVTIKRAAGRADIAQWLRTQAEILEQYGDEYSGNFRARYMYSAD